MKKIIIVAAIVCAAAFTQAASVQWASGAINGVALAGLDGNGSYSAAGSAIKGNGSCNWVVTFYAEGTSTEVGSMSGTTLITGSKISKTSTLSSMSLSTTYDYVVTITASQNDLAGYKTAEWDYSGASLTYTSSGKFTTNPSGMTKFEETPTTWTLTGAVAVPEPTSGLLLLLGMAGLALRRRRA